MSASTHAQSAPGAGSTPVPETMYLRIDQPCRVNGVLHAYLGAAQLDDQDEVIHVFARRAWRPDIQSRLAVTLVRERDLAESVVPIRRSLLE